MSARTIPTYRRQRLGAEVRRIRTAAGMSAEEAAALMGMDRSKIPHIESGTRTINEERLRTLAANCGCFDEDYIAGLVSMAARLRRHWWDEYRGKLPAGMLDISELEWHAGRLHTTQTVHLPGLLQTEDYARAIFDSFLPKLSRLEVELRVAHRQERGQVLAGDNPTPYVGYIHEAALRMQFGGRAVARAQLEYLIERGQEPHISLRVISFEHGIFPGAGHALLYAEGPVPQLDTAQLDTAHGPHFAHAEAQLAQYRSHLRWMDETALSERESRDFIHGIAKQL
ncbi:helix-turn-helix domain-containing protein [Streptomyces sp. NPDC086023]|uniref:helix-turn-helix domain-containing protein n=1 Tax=Streptomyces sp. NPDC086023 TaxID=3365746 RepID=UPI0037CD55E5